MGLGRGASRGAEYAASSHAPRSLFRGRMARRPFSPPVSGCHYPGASRQGRDGLDGDTFQRWAEGGSLLSRQSQIRKASRRCLASPIQLSKRVVRRITMEFERSRLSAGPAPVLSKSCAPRFRCACIRPDRLRLSVLDAREFYARYPKWSLMGKMVADTVPPSIPYASGDGRRPAHLPDELFTRRIAVSRVSVTFLTCTVSCRASGSSWVPSLACRSISTLRLPWQRRVLYF